MITGFYFFRRWYERMKSITTPFLYEDECCEYLDSLYTYSMNHGINPDALIRVVEAA